MVGAVLGVDVGGTNIKGAPVDPATGSLLGPRRTVPTPVPADPAGIGVTVADLVGHFLWDGPVGVGFPAPVVGSIIHGAAHIDDSWIGLDGPKVFGAATGLDVVVLNDADAAGRAETRLGAARGVGGTVLLLALGTGIGSALFVDGHLVPNTELGLVPIHSVDVETYAAPSVVERDGLEPEGWATRFTEVLAMIEDLVFSDLIVVSGGITAEWERYGPQIQSRAPLLTGHFRDDAGLVGAAITASRET